MKLLSKKYHAERMGKEYQSFTVTVEAEEGSRGYLTVELGVLTRWRSKEEYADYLTWCANEILKLED